MKHNELTKTPYPKNVISDWIHIADEDLGKTNDVVILVMIREVSRDIRDKKIAEYRYRDGMTYDQIAEKMGVTKERIRQILLEMAQRARHPSLIKMIFTNNEIWRKYRR